MDHATLQAIKPRVALAFDPHVVLIKDETNLRLLPFDSATIWSSDLVAYHLEAGRFNVVKCRLTLETCPNMRVLRRCCPSLHLLDRNHFTMSAADMALLRLFW